MIWIGIAYLNAMYLFLGWVLHAPELPWHN